MYSRLTDIATLKHYLDKEGLTPARSSGQNFLISEEVIEGIVVCLEGAPTQVTELGAGTGVLTQALVGSGFHVRAIERDETLTRILLSVLPPKQRGQVEVVKADLKEADWTFVGSYALVGNIPYNLSGFILRRATQLSPVPERIVFLVQQEVAERVTAEPPDMSLVGLSIQLWGRAEIAMRVPPECFWPAPAVHSAVLVIKPHKEMLVLEEREAILGTAKKFFQGKRKQVGGQMQRVFGLRPEQVSTLCEEVGITPLMRPQEISVTQWGQLSTRLRVLSSK